MPFLTNSKRKRERAASNRNDRQRKPRRSKHALFQGDPNTPARGQAREPQVERKTVKTTDPTATPAALAGELAIMHGVTGNLGRRRDFEQRYYTFHKAHGASLRGKYRP